MESQNDTPSNAELLYNQNTLPTEPSHSPIPITSTPKENDEAQTITRPDFIQDDNKQWQAFLNLSNELKLTPQASQALLDFAVNNFNEENMSTQNKQQQLIDTSLNDKEYGGAQFEQSLKTAQKAITQFADDNFISLLEESGLGDHPEMLRFFYRLGQHISEDTFQNTHENASSTPKSVADILYN
jgi:hypothetical protein